MSYTLEMIHVNTKENKFFTDTEESKAGQRFYQETIAQFLESGKMEIHGRSEKRFQRGEGGWQLIRCVSGFTSTDYAEEFFGLIRANTEGNLRDNRRDWHNDQIIFSEVNVLKNSDVVKVVHSCQSAICQEFGNCSTSEKGCEIVHHRETRFKVVYHLHKN